LHVFLKYGIFVVDLRFA